MTLLSFSRLLRAAILDSTKQLRRMISCFYFSVGYLVMIVMIMVDGGFKKLGQVIVLGKE